MDDVWINKIPQITGPKLLRRPPNLSRNSLVAGNGDRTGGNPGNAQRIGRPVLRAGFRPRRSVDQRGAAEQSVARLPSNRQVGSAGKPAGQRGKTGRGPSISCMEGPRLYLCPNSPVLTRSRRIQRLSCGWQNARDLSTLGNWQNAHRRITHGARTGSFRAVRSLPRAAWAPGAGADGCRGQLVTTRTGRGRRRAGSCRHPGRSRSACRRGRVVWCCSCGSWYR